MPLESFFNKENINIKNLTIEEPEKKAGLSFHPEREITDDHWKNIKAELERFRRDGNWSFFAEQAMAMKVLFPDKIEDLNLNQISLNGILSFLKLYKQDIGTDISKMEKFSRLAIAIKTLFPKKAAKLGLDQTIWQELKNQLEWARNGGFWDEFSHQAMAIKILYPEKNNEIGLDDESWAGMNDRLESYDDDGEWRNFLDHAKDMKIVSAERAKNLEINQKAWLEMKALLESSSLYHIWHEFTLEAMQIKILAAEDVKVTDNGLEIVMQKQKKLEKQIHPIPETKKY